MLMCSPSVLILKCRRRWSSSLMSSRRWSPRCPTLWTGLGMSRSVVARSDCTSSSRHSDPPESSATIFEPTQTFALRCGWLMKPTALMCSGCPAPPTSTRARRAGPPPNSARRECMTSRPRTSGDAPAHTATGPPRSRSPTFPSVVGFPLAICGLSRPCRRPPHRTSPTTHRGTLSGSCQQCRQRTTAHSFVDREGRGLIRYRTSFISPPLPPPPHPPPPTPTGPPPCQSEHPLGLIDEPELQRQRPFTADVEHAGNLVIVGTSGSGKSATLRTIAAAASHPRAGPTVVYGLDFAGGALRSLTVLPTVGSIIDASDGERVARLIRYLSDVADERTALFSTVAAGSLGEYRTLAPHQPSHASPTLAPLQPPHASPTPAPHQPSHAPPTPAPTHYAPAASTAHPALAAPTPESVARILLLVDGMAAFRTAHEFTDRGRLFETFTRLATIGRGLGIHTVVTTDRSGAIPPSLHAAFPQRLTLRLPSPADYALANIPEDMLANVPPGRGFYNGHECQIAVPGGSTEPSVQAATLARFGDQLRATGAPPAPEIARLPELIPLAPLPPQVAGRPTIGVADDTLQPIGMPLVGLCVITGPFGSGRTTAVRCLVTTAMTARPTCTRYLLVARGSALADVIEWTEASRNADQADELASRLAGELEAAAHRPLAPTLTPLIVVENAGDFEGLPAEASIARLLKAARRADVPTIVEADTVTLTSVWQIHAELKTARWGIVLQPEETDGNSLFRVQFPRVTRADFPVGRGLLVENGQIRRVQVALP